MWYNVEYIMQNTMLQEQNKLIVVQISFTEMIYCTSSFHQCSTDSPRSSILCPISLLVYLKTSPQSNFYFPSIPNQWLTGSQCSGKTQESAN